MSTQEHHDKQRIKQQMEECQRMLEEMNFKQHGIQPGDIEYEDDDDDDNVGTGGKFGTEEAVVSSDNKSLISKTISEYAREYAIASLALESTTDQDRYVMVLVYLDALCDTLSKDAIESNDSSLLVTLGEESLVLMEQLYNVAEQSQSEFKQQLVGLEIMRIALRFTSTASVIEITDIHDDDDNDEEEEEEQSEEEEEDDQ